MDRKPLFDDLATEASQAFAYHLWLIVDDADIVENSREEIKKIWSDLGFPNAENTLDFFALEKILTSKLGKNPFFALVFTVLRAEKNLDQADFVKFKMLAFSVLIAALSLKEEEEYIDDKKNYNNPISTGCDAARLIVKGDLELLRCLPELSYDINANFYQIEILYETLGGHESAPSYLRLIYNILNKYVNSIGPINRERADFKRIGVAEYPIDDADASALFQLIDLPSSRIRSEELAADQHRDQVDIDNAVIDHADPIEQVPDLQTPNNRYYSYSLSKRHLMTSTMLGRIYTEQASKIYQACLKLYQESCQGLTPKFEYIYLALSIVFGRPDEELRKLKRASFQASAKQHWYVKNKQWHLAYKTPIPRATAPQFSSGRKLDDKKDFFNNVKSEPLLLPVPAEWNKALGQALKTPEYPYDFAEAFKVVQAEVNHSIRRANLPNFLKYTLKQKGVDRYYIALLSGMSPFENAALYYTQTSPRAIYAHYSSIIHELGLAAPNYDGNHDRLFDEWNDLTIGSMNVPKDELITNFFTNMREFIESDKPETELEWLRHHSIMAAYTILVLNICTGHRPSISAYSKACYIDIRGKKCFIADKQVTSVTHGREVPLIDVAVEQFQAYQRHLERFVNFLKGPRGCAVLLSKVLKCIDDGDDKYPFVFLFTLAGPGEEFSARKHREPRSASPLQLRNIIDSSWPIPTNWHRHYLRSYLTNFAEKGTSSELIDAFMGHGQYSSNPENPMSGFSYNTLKNLSVSLDAMCENLEVKAVKL